MSPTLWQSPTLYTDASHGEHQERKIGWLELFYDLVYVATLIQLGDVLSSDVSVGGILRFVALFIPIWWSWTGMTFYSNRFVTDDLLHRILIFAQILTIAAMGISINGAFGALYVQFTLAYVAVRLVLVLLYLRVAWSLPEAAPFARRYALGFFIASMVWLIGAFVPAPYYVVFWALGMLVDFAVPLSSRSRALNAELPIDVHHVMERYGIFVIIVLGESFVKVLSSISGSVLTVDMGIFGVFAIIVVGGLWWLYFDDVAGVPLRATGAAAYVWIYSHLPITIALTAFGVGLKKLFLEIDHSYVTAKYHWLIGLSMILYLVFIGVINLGLTGSNRGISRQTRSIVRFAGAAAILVLILLSGKMSATIFMAISAIVFAIQIAVELIADQQSKQVAEETHA